MTVIGKLTVHLSVVALTSELYIRNNALSFSMPEKLAVILNEIIFLITPPYPNKMIGIMLRFLVIQHSFDSFQQMIINLREEGTNNAMRNLIGKISQYREDLL